MDSTILDALYGFPCERRFVGVLSGEKMTIIIDWWIIFPIALGFVGACLAFYEFGQRKGLETAEKLYAPLLNRIADMIDTTEHSMSEKLERGTPSDYVEED